MLLIDDPSQGAVTRRERDQLGGDTYVGKGCANSLAADPSIDGFGKLGVLDASAASDSKHRVLVLGQILVPLLAENSIFLYCMTHFAKTFFGFF